MADASYVAYHEAGHAIVDVLLGHRFDAVYVYEKSTLVRGNWYVGLVDGDPDAVYFRRDNAVAALAGPVAEARYTGKTRDDAFRNKLGAGECADVLNARRQLADCGLPHFTFAAAVDETEELVARHWPEICAVAEVLVQKRKLEEREVVDIIRAATKGETNAVAV